MSQPIYILKGTEEAAGTGSGTASNVGSARIVRCVNSGTTARLVTLEESGGTDIRAFVVGDEVVASMKRIAPEGEFRSNVHRGGTMEKVQLTPEEENMAVNASRILGLSIAGVDLMRSNRGPLILEVNSSPGLQGIESCSEVDVAEKIILHIQTWLR